MVEYVYGITIFPLGRGGGGVAQMSLQHFIWKLRNTGTLPRYKYASHAMHNHLLCYVTPEWSIGRYIILIRTIDTALDFYTVSGILPCDWGLTNVSKRYLWM